MSGSTGASDAAPNRLLRWAPVVVPASAMLVLSLWGLNRPSMFGSEADTYWASQLGFPHLLRLLGHVDAVHGTYYLFVHVLFLGGADPTLMRVPSALAAVGATAMVSILATRLSGRSGVGLVAAVLYLLLPSTNSWAQSGRSYAIVTFVVTVLVWSLLRAVEAQGSAVRRWIVFGAMTVVAGYLHEMTLLLVPAFAVSLWWGRVPRRTLARWALTTAVAVALVSPLILISAGERAAVAHLRRPDLRSIEELIHVYTGTSQPIAYALGACIVVGAAAGLMQLRRGAQNAGEGVRSLSPVQVALPMLIVPPSLLFTVSRVATSLFDTRYVLYGAVAAVVLAACGLDFLGHVLACRVAREDVRRALTAAPAVVLCAAAALLLSPSLERLRTPAGHGQDYGGSSRYLAAHARAGDGLIFSTHSARNAELGYPQQYRGLVDIALDRTPEQTATFRGTSAKHVLQQGRLARLTRVWIVGPYPAPAGAHGLHESLPTLFTQFRRVSVGRFAGVDDTLLVRVTPAR